MELHLSLQQDRAQNQGEASARSRKYGLGLPPHSAGQLMSTANGLAIRKMRKRGRKRGRSNVYIPPPPPPPKAEDGPQGDDKRNEDEMEQGLHGDKEEMLSMTWLVRGWMLDCTAHGVGKIISNSNFKRRAFWLLATLCSASMLLYQLGSMFIDIQTYPVTVNLQVVAQPSLLFPVITICNSNKLKRSTLTALPDKHPLHKGVVFEKYSLVGLSDVKDTLTERSLSFKNGTLSSTTPAPVNESSTCQMDRDYLGQAETSLEYTDYCWSYFGYTWCATDNVTDYKGVVSPENQFECGSGECVSQVNVCDRELDCEDGSDEAVETCSGCATDEFACRDGNCISVQLRCNSVFDCPDGSDELREHCDLDVMDPGLYVCCNTDVMVPREHLCDGVDDCLRDKSDTYLFGCVPPSRMWDTNSTLPCPRIGTKYADGFTDYLTPDQIGDGVVDCLFDMDEICAWQMKLEEWVSPTETDEYAQYEEFVGFIQNEPAKTRWYTMANESMIRHLGHQKQDLIMQCVYDNRACDIAMTDPIEIVDQDYGKCYSYVAKEHKTSLGIKYGFSVIFNLEAYDTIGFFAPSSSLKMFLTHPETFSSGEDAFIERSSLISLEAGHEHVIEIHPVRQTKLPSPYSLCDKYGEGRFHQLRSKQQCESDCRSRMNKEVCGCVDDVSFPNGTLCELSNKFSRRCVDRINTQFDPSDNCDCPTSCVSLGYEKLMTFGLYPTSVPNFFASLMAASQSESTTDFSLEVVEKHTRDELEGTDNGIRLLSKSIGKVTVYFKDLTETTVEERPVYDFITILSTCGGLLGLYLGFSLLTILEAVDFFFDLYEVATVHGMKRRFDGRQKQLAKTTAGVAGPDEVDSSEESQEEISLNGCCDNEAFDSGEFQQPSELFKEGEDPKDMAGLAFVREAVTKL